MGYSYYPSYKLHNNWNNYYGYGIVGNYYGYNYWNIITTTLLAINYIYWNGNHYYRMNDGSYRIYRGRETFDNSNNNSSYQQLETIRTIVTKMVTITMYGQWRLITTTKNGILGDSPAGYNTSTTGNTCWTKTRTTNNLLSQHKPSQPEVPAQTSRIRDSTPVINSEEPTIASWATTSNSKCWPTRKTPPLMVLMGEFDPFKTIYRNANEPKPETPDNPATQQHQVCNDAKWKPNLDETSWRIGTLGFDNSQCLPTR